MRQKAAFTLLNIENGDKIPMLKKVYYRMMLNNVRYFIAVNVDD